MEAEQEERNSLAKFFHRESCAAPAAGRRNPVDLPPLPVDRGTPGDGFGILTDKKAAPRFSWAFSRPLNKHGKRERTRRKRRRFLWNRRRNALFSSVTAWKRLKFIRFSVKSSENGAKQRENGVKPCVSRRFSVNPSRFALFPVILEKFCERSWQYIYIYIW